MEPIEVQVWSHCKFTLICVGSEFVSECLCLGESRRCYSAECRRVEFLYAGGDRRENIVCVACCAEVRSFPARPIKSGCFPLTMSTVNNCWSSLSVC